MGDGRRVQGSLPGASTDRACPDGRGHGRVLLRLSSYPRARPRRGRTSVRGAGSRHHALHVGRRGRDRGGAPHAGKGVRRGAGRACHFTDVGSRVRAAMESGSDGGVDRCGRGDLRRGRRQPRGRRVQPGSGPATGRRPAPSCGIVAEIGQLRSGHANGVGGRSDRGGAARGDRTWRCSLRGHRRPLVRAHGRVHLLDGALGESRAGARNRPCVSLAG